MVIRLRTGFFLLITAIIVWFLYLERAILPPFILGGIFAYLFNPTISFLNKKTKVPRAIAITLLYLVLITLLVGLGTFLTKQLLSESLEINNYVNYLLVTARSQINTLPEWLKPTVYDVLLSFRKTPLAGSYSLAPLFPQALSKLIGFLIFIFSGAYFLNDGGGIIHRILRFVPHDLKVDVEILLRKINYCLGAYLRGQIFLVFLMSLWTFLALSILGVRFALIIGIFSGFAEIVPVIGPIVAGAVAVLVVLLSGVANFNLPPFNAALVVVIIYFLLRQIEDYFVIPHVMGKITKLPPFLIFFAVIAGGHLFGILGLVLAVPVTASLRLLLEFTMDHINKDILPQDANKPDSV